MKQLLITIVFFCLIPILTYSQTTGSGGGVYVHGGGRVEGSLIKDNKAATEGTGVYVEKGEVTSSTIVNNLQTATPAMPTWIHIPGGTFEMGCTAADGAACWPDEEPTHSVTLSGFYLSESEVTNAQYCTFLNAVGVPSTGIYSVPGYGSQTLVTTHAWGVAHNGTSWVPQSGYSDYPVINVNWYGAYSYCQYYGFRLPTEAEWEYAARGGAAGQAYSGSATNDNAGLETVGWYFGNSGSATHAVKGKLANGYGLYDMSGNVWEWTNSGWTDNYNDTTEDLSGRVFRGGSWGNNAQYCRVSYRSNNNPINRSFSLGFRVGL